MGKGKQILDWENAVKIPWGILLLFAGGITIAKAFTTSGLGQLLSDGFSNVLPGNIFLLIALLCLFVTFLTEITSNTATTTLLMPILAAVAVKLDIPPALIMIPAVMSASCAFMLPVADSTETPLFSAVPIFI